MSELRRTLFPYGMARNSDGSWTFFNRDYKPVGTVTKDWADWEVATCKVNFKRQPTKATLRALDVHGLGEGDRIYFYHDGCIPTNSAVAMKTYLEKLSKLMKFETIS